MTKESETSTSEVRKTPLYDRHVALGARMIPFAGWLMPVQYTGIIQEHRAVRSTAGLFDLGHMGEVEVSGPDALAFLQYATTNDVSKIEPGKAQYGLLPNDQGGVVDDVIVYRRPDGDGYMVVVNAANHEKDVAWLNDLRKRRSDLDVTIEDRSDETGMIAIQGPAAERLTQPLTDTDLSGIENFAWTEGTVAGVPCMIARTGYTGEDGFEFYCPIEGVGKLWDALLAAKDGEATVVPVGLGARDTLRLEARMPLYGNEMDMEITPLEAGLGWAVKFDKGDFVGRAPLAAMKEAGIPRKSVGFKMAERSGAPRSHYEVQLDGKNVGFVTSGAFSPTLEENIGLALVDREVAGVDRPLDIVIRGKPVKAVQVKTPFYRRST